MSSIAMLARADTARVLPGSADSSWVSADEAYGRNLTFRTWLSDQEIPFVLATRNDV